MTELHPAVADLDPRLSPLSKQGLDLAGIDIVVNTHLHFDHCGGNHLFAGRPIYVQRLELDDARIESGGILGLRSGHAKHRGKAEHDPRDRYPSPPRASPHGRLRDTINNAGSLRPPLDGGKTETSNRNAAASKRGRNRVARRSAGLGPQCECVALPQVRSYRGHSH